MAKEMNSKSAMIASDRPKTPMRALKKATPRSVVTTTPVARHTENGVALICASLKGVSAPSVTTSRIASPSLPTVRIHRNDNYSFAVLRRVRRLLPVIALADKAYRRSLRNVKLLRVNPYPELFAKDHAPRVQATL